MSASQRQRRSARTTTTGAQQGSSEPPQSAAPPTVTTTAPSSTASTSQTRAERNTRTAKRTQSPRAGSERRSESQSQSRSRDHSGGVTVHAAAGAAASKENLQPRRSRRGAEVDVEGADKDVNAKVEDQDDEEEEGEGEPEEEVTRCICGQAEYPGPPAWIRERDTGTSGGVGAATDEGVSDDLGNFFVQCDSCQVWQHGGCMGLTDESMLPEQYYCEECRPGSHKIVMDRNGVKSSQYLPVLQGSSSRSSSLSAGEPTKKNDRRQQSDASLSNAKRRATMNSRTALDDDELLRQAIEESKEMGTLGKRTRDESEDNRHLAKRQRTNSSSGPDPTKRSRSLSEAGSETGQNGGTKDSRRIRGAAAKNQREKELREKQREKELAATQRAEAARKREARSERRRGDDSPPPTPTFSPSKPATSNKETPPPAAKSNINNLRQPSNKAGTSTSRSHARRGRLGRNQYTRDRDVNGGSIANGGGGDVSDTPGREDSQEGSPNGNGANGNGNGVNSHGESGRSSKAKTHGARTSMNEMKRRVAAILEFVGRMQGEGGAGNPVVKAERERDSGGSSSAGGGGAGGGDGSGNASANGGTPKDGSVVLPTASLVKAVEMAIGSVDGGGASGGAVQMFEESGKEFKEMATSAEMMEVLTGELIGWQNVYGRYGEK